MSDFCRPSTLRSAAALIAALALVAATPSAAQQAGLRVGAMTVYPVLGLSIGYDDNVALQVGEGVQGAAFLLVSPGVRLETGGRRSSVRLALTADVADYEGTSQDDYADWQVAGDWTYEPTIRAALGASGRYRRDHFRRGQGLQEFVRPPPEPRDVDRFRAADVDSFFTYGADGARGRLELTAGWSDFEYENNRDLTAIADFATTRLGASFGWQVAPKTRLLAVARREDNDYDSDSRDNRATFLGLGVAWSATARTAGRIEAGRREVDYEGANADFSGSSWLAAVEWQPRDYTMVEVATRRSTDSAFGNATFVVRENYELTWRHQWRARLGTVVDLGVAAESLRPGTREDQVLSASAAMLYDFRRWLQLGISYRYFDRDSDDPAFDVERGELLLSTELAF